MGPTGAGQVMALLERRRELDAIDRAITDAASGSGAGLVLRGPAGIGKSTLLVWARERAAASGLTVLAARGALLEHQYPFGIARQLLVDDGGEDAAAAAFAPDAIFAATYNLYRRLAALATDCPTLVAVDDIQWSDEPSLRLLDFVLRRLADLPMTIIVALRSDEPTSATADAVIAELESGALVEVVEPAPLSEHALLSLAEMVFGADVDGEFAAACHARTAGNPFFAVELLRELFAGGVEPSASGASRVEANAPRLVSRIVLARLARLGPDASALARSIAVLGDGGRVADASELAGMPRERGAAAAEVLIASEFLSDGERLVFKHPLMRDAIESDIPLGVRGELHARAAAVLAALGRAPEAIAAHTLASPPVADPLAVQRLRDAARLAVVRAAPDEAAALLDRALAEPPPEEAVGGVLFELGTAEALSGRAEAIEHLNAARARAGPGREQAEVALVLGRLLVFAGQSAEVYRLVDEASAGLCAEDREFSLALEALKLTASTMDPAGYRLTPAEVEQLGLHSGATAAERSVLASLAFELTKRAHPVRATLQWAERAIAEGGCELRPGADPFTPLMLVTVLQFGGQLKRATSLTTGLMDQARAIGSSVLFTEAVASRAMAHWRAGRLGESEADARQSLATEGIAPGLRSPVAVAALTRTLVETGALNDAWEVATGYELAAERQDLVVKEILLTSMGRIDVAAGRCEQALDKLLQAGEIVEAAGTFNPAVSEWRMLAAEAMIGSGRHAEAGEMLAPAVAAARASGNPVGLGPALRLAALVERPVSVELLREARAELEPSELRLELARVTVELGAALRRAGNRREARDPLVAGIELAHGCGAAALVERGRTELRAAGGRPRRIERTGVDALTPSERRVALLALEGRSNRQIADHLFVSPRTVESQLRSTYMKLGIATRQELAGVMAGVKDQ